MLQTFSLSVEGIQLLLQEFVAAVVVGVTAWEELEVSLVTLVIRIDKISPFLFMLPSLAHAEIV